MSFKFNALTGAFNTFTRADLTSIGGSNDLSFDDNAKIKLGASDDLRIYHYQSHSYIDNNTNNLYINAPNYFHLGVSNGGDKYITATENGVVELYYDGSKKFETTSLGTTVTGQLDVQGANNTTFDHVGTISLQGTDAYNSGNAGAGILFSGKYNSSNAVTTLAQISGIKEDTSDGTYDGALTFGVRNDAEGVDIERMRLDSSGQLLLNETTAGGTCRLGMSFGNATGNYMELGGTQRAANGLSKVFVFRHGYWGGSKEVASIGVTTTSSTGGSGRGLGTLVFHTGTSGNGDGGSDAAERMNIDPNGKTKLTHNHSTSTQPILHLDRPNAGSDAAVDMIHFDSGGQGRGKLVSASSDAGSPALASRSDYRIKENIRDYTDGWDNIKAVPVKLFDVKTDGSKDQKGWIAHELQAVLPDLVQGAKDAVVTQAMVDNEESDKKELGNPIYQTVSMGLFMPDVISALQTAIAKIETLETKVAALEAA